MGLSLNRAPSFCARKPRYRVAFESQMLIGGRTPIPVVVRDLSDDGLMIITDAPCSPGTGRKDVRLANLSRTGALIEGPQLPSVGQNVVLKSGSVDVFATVVWRSEGRCGITFDKPVREEEV